MQRAEIKRYFDENRKKWCIRKFPNDKHSRLKDNSKIQAIVSILGAELCLRYFGVFRYILLFLFFSVKGLLWTNKAFDYILPTLFINMLT